MDLSTTGLHFLQRLWPKYVDDVPWDTLIKGLIHLETLAKSLQRDGPRPRRGAPVNKLRHVLEEMVAWVLVRGGYELIPRSRKTGQGVYSRVIAAVLDGADEEVPSDTARLARTIDRKLRAFQAHEEAARQ